jgi:MFS family permease
MIISESIPSLARGKLVLGAFAFQAIGALFGTAVGCLVLVLVPDLGAWRWMFATALFPAILVTLGRFFIVESPNWLHARGHHEKAQEAVTKLLVRTPQYPSEINLKRHTEGAQPEKPSFWALFNRRNRRATIFASAPWFIQDLGTYGIGIFTPTILAAALGGGADHIRSVSD